MGFTELHYSDRKGYRAFIDDDGNKFYQNKKTGEIHQALTKTVEYLEGGYVYDRTPEQIKAADKFNEMQDAKEQRKLERKRNKEFGFYFVQSKDRRGILKPQTIARLFYLATFLHYNSSTLRHSDGTPIKKVELPKLMKLGEGTFKDFWKEVNNQYIFIQKDKSLTISKEFLRGRITASDIERSGEDGYQQVYIKSLQELYRQTPVKKHRYLGYLFLLLPWINWEYNVLCWNPQEKDKNKIDIMTLENFCEQIGYDSNGSNNTTKLLDAYNQLTFTKRGKQQEVCAYLTNRANGKSYFVMNPAVIYRGSDRRKVEAFGVFFRSKTHRNDLLTEYLHSTT